MSPTDIECSYVFPCTWFGGFQAILGRKKGWNHPYNSSNILLLCPTVHNFGPFRPFCIEKQVRNRLQTGPSNLLWALRSLHNGPIWSKIAPKGSNQYSMVKLCPTVPDLWPFKSFLVAKQLRNRLQTGPSLLLWALKTFVSSNGSNSGNFGTFWNL